MAPLYDAIRTSDNTLISNKKSNFGSNPITMLWSTYRLCWSIARNKPINFRLQFVRDNFEDWFWWFCWASFVKFVSFHDSNGPRSAIRMEWHGNDAHTHSLPLGQRVSQNACRACNCIGGRVHTSDQVNVRIEYWSMNECATEAKCPDKLVYYRALCCCCRARYGRMGVQLCNIACLRIETTRALITSIHYSGIAYSILPYDCIPASYLVGCAFHTVVLYVVFCFFLHFFCIFN